MDWELDGTKYNNYWTNQFTTTFYTAGTHNLTFTATYGTCQQTVTRSFMVNDLPKLDGFLMDIKDICGPPARVEFKDTSSDAVSWEWDFDTNNYASFKDATTKEASTTYPFNTGTYVGLRTYNAAGCSKQVLKNIQIQAPFGSIFCTTPKYMYGDIVVCGPVTLSFKANLYQNSIASYKWIIDNTVVSTDPEPTHTFTSVGLHGVRLEFITDKGCKGTIYFDPDIDIRTTYNGNFNSLSGNTICGNSRVFFQSRSNAPWQVNQYWYINDRFVGSSYYNTFDYQFPDTGKYSIKLITDNYGCRDTLNKVDYITVLGPFPKISKVTNSCDVREEVTFNQASRYGEKWVWDFGDGATATYTTEELEVKHKYNATGKYKVKLTVTKGQCSVTDSVFAYVYLKPSPVLSAPKIQICPNEPFDFTLTNLPRQPYDGYVVDFYFHKIEYGDGTTFNGTNNSSWTNSVDLFQHNGKLTNFDAGKTGLRMILRESYHGCYDTTNYIPVVVNGNKAGFRILNNDVCFNTPVQFEDTSKVNPGNSIVKWEWSFGDNQTITNQQGGAVSHSYNSPGTYNVILKVTDAAGCVTNSSQFSTIVKVNGPKAAFNASNTVIPYNTTVYFYNTTNDYSNYRATYQWDFGDGGQSAVTSPQHTFTTPGKYLVTLTATDPVTGCSSVYTTTITVNSWLSFTRTLIGQTNCLPMLINFSVPNSNIDSIRWDFGDGSTAGNMRNTAHVYDKPGKYYITLTAKDPSGQILRYIDSINISTPAIKALATGLEGCPGANISWNLSGLNANGFTWDYGDGTTSQGQNYNTSHVYAQAGTYSPVLLIIDSNGCMQSAGLTDKVVIHPNPIITVNPANGIACLSKPFQLTATGANSYTWSPAIGLSDPQNGAPLATPPQTTTYRVEGVDGYGCKGFTDYTLTVKDPFTIQVSPPAEICEGKTIELKASGADLYTWINTTDGLSDTRSATTIAVPKQTTEYTVVGADIYRCFTDTASVIITVNPIPTVEAGSDIELKPGENVQLSPMVSSNVVSWKWIPADYLTCTNCSSPVCKPEADTRYTIKVATQKGCEASDEVLVKITCGEQFVRIPNAFTPNGDGRNDVFGVKGISKVDYMVIYNRWGNKVFERKNFVPTDASSSWDGTYNGIPQPTESYVYMIQVHCPSGEAFIKKGTVTLVR
jgi:gliding motility-associated-like protein